MTEEWTGFCVVGLGSHARTKLIPALAANAQQLVGVVSAKPDAGALGAPVFRGVDEALATLPRDTTFIVASPPSAHIVQSEAILSAGRDLIVEKPPFVTRNEAERVLSIARRTGALLIEGFMNRYTITHRHFVSACRGEIPTRIGFVFTIPEAPTGTFRSDTAIGASNLYDIGSYVLAALLDVGLPLDDLMLSSVKNAGFPERELVELEGRLHGVQVTARVGVDREYRNRVELSWDTGRVVAYEPFFFGRQANRIVTLTDRTGTRTECIADVDAFAAMFAVPPAVWAADAEERGERILALATHLERLGAALSSARTR